MLVEPYLFFDGKCEEAIEFYRRALGAEVEMLMRFRDCPEPVIPEAPFTMLLAIGGTATAAGLLMFRRRSGPKPAAS